MTVKATIAIETLALRIAARIATMGLAKGARTQTLI
jgi:hypothetical protein